MNFIDTLVGRNAAFAASGFDTTLRIMPTQKTIILGCADPRVDPEAISG